MLEMFCSLTCGRSCEKKESNCVAVDRFFGTYSDPSFVLNPVRIEMLVGRRWSNGRPGTSSPSITGCHAHLNEGFHWSKTTSDAFTRLVTLTVRRHAMSLHPTSDMNVELCSSLRLELAWCRAREYGPPDSMIAWWNTLFWFRR